jgi:Flp pilus assembly pilin Flp
MRLTLLITIALGTLALAAPAVPRSPEAYGDRVVRGEEKEVASINRFARDEKEVASINRFARDEKEVASINRFVRDEKEVASINRVVRDEKEVASIN